MRGIESNGCKDNETDVATRQAISDEFYGGLRKGDDDINKSVNT